MLTRWDDWFSADNLASDPRILAARPSRCAQSAAQAFLACVKGPILDLACGVGRDTFYLARCGLTVVGVDASLNALRAARQFQEAQGVDLPWMVADARRLPFGDGMFGGVYCFGLLHEFTGEDRQRDVAQVMAEIRRVMHDHGLLALAVLAGDPTAGLPAVQLFDQAMFEEATAGWQPLRIETRDDVGCTGRTDYRVWFGMLGR